MKFPKTLKLMISSSPKKNKASIDLINYIHETVLDLENNSFKISKRLFVLINDDSSDDLKIWKVKLNIKKDFRSFEEKLLLQNSNETP